MSSQNRVFCIFLIYFFYLSGPSKATAKTQLWFKFLVVYGGKALKFYIVDSVSTMALRGPISCKIFTSANRNFYFHNFFSTSATFFFTLSMFFTSDIFFVLLTFFAPPNCFLYFQLFISLFPLFASNFSLNFRFFFTSNFFLHFQLLFSLPTFFLLQTFCSTSNFFLLLTFF